MRSALIFSLVALAAGPILAFPADAGHNGATVPCADARGCPDLWVDGSVLTPYQETRTFSAWSCAVQEGMVKQGTRTLLRFEFSTPNTGAGDLIVGNPSQHPEWFVWGACHNHWHFREYADYRLWKPETYALWELLRALHSDMTAAQVLALYPLLQDGYLGGFKQGFCVIDIRQYVAGTPRNYLSCSGNQGISVGWADVYAASLDGQWIDITGVAPGTYVLEAEVNAERLYQESNYANNRGSRSITI